MQPDLTPSSMPQSEETADLPDHRPRVHPMVRRSLGTSTYRSWSDFILISHQPGSPLTRQVRELYRAIGSSFLGFLLSKNSDAGKRGGSDLELDSLLRGEMQKCTPDCIKEFLRLQGQKRERGEHEAASVIYNHFSRWAVKLGYMSEALFPHLRNERYESVLAQSALRNAFEEYLANLKGGEAAPTMSAESQGNVRRIISRFLRTVARANFPEVAANEGEPDYKAVAFALDGLVAARLADLLKDYCRLKSEGGIFESKASLLTARSALYKYFAKVVPGGEKLAPPPAVRQGKRRPKKGEAPSPPAAAPALEAEALPPARPAPSPEELKARYENCLEAALFGLAAALGRPRHELSLLRLSDVRDLDLKLRVFTAQIPALSSKGNFIDVHHPAAYRAVLRYFEACRGRPPRKSFFFETFEGHPVVSQQPGKKKR